MTGYEAYKYYLALKLHFTTDKYDVFDQNGRVFCKRESFDKRNDRMLFERIAVKKKTPREFIDFCVANFAHYNLQMMYEQSEAENIHKQWLANKEKLSYMFMSQCSTILNKSGGKDPFRIEKGIPVLMSMYLNGDVSIETMSILNRFEDYLKNWQSLNFIWGPQFRTINKINKFVKFDYNKLHAVYKNILKEELKEVNYGQNISQSAGS